MSQWSGADPLWHSPDPASLIRLAPLWRTGISFDSSFSSAHTSAASRWMCALSYLHISACVRTCVADRQVHVIFRRPRSSRVPPVCPLHCRNRGVCPHPTCRRPKGRPAPLPLPRRLLLLLVPPPGSSSSHSVLSLLLTLTCLSSLFCLDPSANCLSPPFVTLLHFSISSPSSLFLSSVLSPSHHHLSFLPLFTEQPSLALPC